MVDLVKIGVLRRKLAKVKEKTQKQLEKELDREFTSFIKKDQNEAIKKKLAKAKKDLDVDEEIENKKERDSEKRQRSIETGG